MVGNLVGFAHMECVKKEVLMRIFDSEIFVKGFRKDGWPFCPDCGNDELYLDGDLDLVCYFCHWKECDQTAISK